MCTDCDNTSIVVPIGDDGRDGLDGVATNGLDGVQERVAFDTTLSISYSTNDFLLSIPLDSNNNPDITAFRTVAYIIFPGTDNLQSITPNKCYVVGAITSESWIIRLRDSSNTIIAESTSITNPTQIIIDLGAVSGLPTSLDMLTLEIYPLNLIDITSTLEIDSFLLIQE